MPLPAWVPADGPIGAASFTSSTDTGGCTHTDEAFGPCIRPPHSDPTHRTRWGQHHEFEARWTTVAQPIIHPV